LKWFRDQSNIVVDGALLLTPYAVCAEAATGGRARAATRPIKLVLTENGLFFRAGPFPELVRST
jgi:hypothetical protein